MASDIKKVLVIGSGPIVIGQAAEFDYAGTQACRALREEGIQSILVNSNPATIMTDEGVADVVYIEPLTVEVVRRIIAKERPDACLPTLGGQTGLNLAMELHAAGVFEEYGVRLLGANPETIRMAEDREAFKDLLISIDEPVVDSAIVHTVEEGARSRPNSRRRSSSAPPTPSVAPVAASPSRWINSMAAVQAGIDASPIGQILLERYLNGWKEIEYEVMRDSADTCITICNMENLDPMGVHTGDSIVVAPSQTLSDREYQMLRSSALKIIRALGIEGGCNVQYSLDPHSFQYYVIEVNPRVSRSSALASKATGYPIARLAAKIAVGRRLDEVPNAVTGKTVAAFEPALDYCVVKIPRWPFDKFVRADRTLGTQMKATGEVMAIDRSFEAALAEGAPLARERHARPRLGIARLAGRGRRRSPARTRRPPDRPCGCGRSLPPCGAATPPKISPRAAATIRGSRASWPASSPSSARSPPRAPISARAPLAGEADGLLRPPDRPPHRSAGRGCRRAPPRGRDRAGLQDGRYLRRRVHRHHAVLLLDLRGRGRGDAAAVAEGGRPRLRADSDRPGDRVRLLLRSGGAVARRGRGRLDHDQLQPRDGLHRLRHQRPPLLRAAGRRERDGGHPARGGCRARMAAESGIQYPPAVVQFGGQTAINLAAPLDRAGVPIIGTSRDVIDIAEDRRRFEAFLRAIGIPQPPGAATSSLEEAMLTAERIGYPILVRPSYVLGGRAMEVVHTPDTCAITSPRWSSSPATRS